MSCDLGEAKEVLENEARATTVTQVKQREDCRMSCDVGEATKVLENEARATTVRALLLRKYLQQGSEIFTGYL